MMTDNADANAAHLLQMMFDAAKRLPDDEGRAVVYVRDDAVGRANIAYAIERGWVDPDGVRSCRVDVSSGIPMRADRSDGVTP